MGISDHSWSRKRTPKSLTNTTLRKHTARSLTLPIRLFLGRVNWKKPSKFARAFCAKHIIRLLTIPTRSLLRGFNWKKPWKPKRSLWRLFFDLPPEIRQHIYSLALPQNVSAIHISSRSNCCPTARKCYHVLCRRKHDEPKSIYICVPCAVKWDEEGHAWNVNWSIPDNLFVLPKSCRRFYEESIDLMYASWPFNIKGEDRFVTFTTTVRENLDRVRMLHLEWTCPLRTSRYREGDHFVCGEDQQFVGETWENACGILSNMRGLKQLIIDIDGEDGPIPKKAETEMQVLEPLMGIKQVKSFEVQIVWKLMNCQYLETDYAPFVVTYRASAQRVDQRYM